MIKTIKDLIKHYKITPENGVPEHALSYQLGKPIKTYGEYPTITIHSLHPLVSNHTYQSNHQANHLFRMCLNHPRMHCLLQGLVHFLL